MQLYAGLDLHSRNTFIGIMEKELVYSQPTENVRFQMDILKF
jgi:hypothetical protein